MSDERQEAINKAYLILDEVATEYTGLEESRWRHIVELEEENRKLKEGFNLPKADPNVARLRRKNLRLLKTIARNNTQHREAIAALKRIHAEEMMEATDKQVEYSNRERDALEQIYDHVERVLGYEERRG